MSNIRYLDDGRSDGTVLGQSSTALIGLWGATPIVQPLGASQSAVSTATITAVSTATAVTGGYSYSTTAAFTTMQDTVNSLVTRVAALTVLANKTRTDLVALGIQAGHMPRILVATR